MKLHLFPLYFLIIIKNFDHILKLSFKIRIAIHQNYACYQEDIIWGMARKKKSNNNNKNYNVHIHDQIGSC